MKLHLYIVVTPALEQTVHQVQARLRQALPDLSFSPAAEQQSLENCLEFHGTADCTGEDGEYWAYGFNTRMADPAIYYFRLEF